MHFSCFIQLTISESEWSTIGSGRQSVTYATLAAFFEENDGLEVSLRRKMVVPDVQGIELM